MFNSKMLKAKMTEKGKNAEYISSKLGIDTSTFYRKLGGKSEFNRSEILIIKNSLSLNKKEMDSIFFS